MLKYLARYLTGGPISDRRLVSQQNGQVTFTARAGRTTGGDADDVEQVTVPGVEFVRLWCLHILPSGYTKTRRYGGWSNTRKADYLDHCRTLLPEEAAPSGTDPPADTDTTDAVDPTDAVECECVCCPHCAGPLRLVWSVERSGWWDVMHGPHRPPWYARRWSPPGAGHG